MASPEHLEILKQGVEVWNKWREDNPDVVPNLEEKEIDLNNLRRIDLRGANLRETTFRRSDLSEANLKGAYLYDANLEHVNISKAVLKWANLNYAKLLKSDLSGANLSNSDFFAANLSHVNLCGANLEHADLSGANLKHSNLSDADLGRAKLIKVNLSGTKLEKANLSGANLKYANINDVVFSNASLNCAKLSFCKIVNTDLSEVRGLNSIFHYGPSSIGTDTLLRSEGKIPDNFLKGCGLLPWEIEQAKFYRNDLTNDQIIDIQNRVFELRSGGNVLRFYSCFISYSHTDKPFAQKLHDRLQERGIRCWLDEHQLLPGDDIYAQVDRGIRLWDKVLLCSSESSLTSWWVDNEVEKALEKEQKLLRERGEQVLSIIPLNLDGYLFDSACTYPKGSTLRKRLAADFTGWQKDDTKFDSQFERVVKALRADGGAREEAPESRL